MDSEDCLASLRAALPALTVGSAALVADQGWDFWTFVVDGEWIFRFPRNGGAARALEREMAALPAIAAALPLQVPNYAWQGDWMGLPFGGYRRIEGQSLRPADFGRPAIATKLAESLTALHSLDPASLALPQGESLDANRWFDDQHALLSGAAATGLLERDLSAHLASLRSALEEFADLAWQPVPVHNDLGAVHLIVRDGELSGIIDWTDMMIGDPAIDFAPVLTGAGETALALVLSHYQRPPGNAFDRRVRYYACVSPLHDVLHGLAINEEAIVRDGLVGFASRRDFWKGQAAWGPGGS